MALPVHSSTAIAVVGQMLQKLVFIFNIFLSKKIIYLCSYIYIKWKNIFVK